MDRVATLLCWPGLPQYNYAEGAGVATPAAARAHPGLSMPTVGDSHANGCGRLRLWISAEARSTLPSDVSRRDRAQDGGMDVALAPITLRIHHRNQRAPWEIEIPGHRAHLHCETLADARRIAYLCVAHRRPCELTVLDAYDRVIEHELLH